jgi:Transglutaminase-like superfamily
MLRAAVCVLLLSLASPAGAAGPPPAPDSLAAWAKRSQGRYAYGMYVRGKKMGWIVMDLKLATHGGRPVLQTTQESHSVTLFDGEKSVKTDKVVVRYELAGEGTILSAEKTVKEDGRVSTYALARHGKGVRVTTRLGDRTRGAKSRDAATPKDTLALTRRFEAWLADGRRKKGDTFVNYGLAWDRNDIDQKETHTYRARKPILLAGLKTTVYEVQIEEDGSKMDAVLLPDGKPLKATLGTLMSLQLEAEADAKKLNGKPVDLMDLTSIFVDKDLGRGALVDELKLEVTGLGDFKVPASHRQKVSTDAAGKTILELRRDFRAEKAAPLTKDELKKHTRSTPRLQCQEKAIKEQAEKIVGDETDAVKKARKLQGWVHKTLKKSYSDNAETALQVLDNKAGDCTEHSLLFVALARAAGLPAREVGGLAFVAGSKPLFGWHAWAEVHDGRQWVTVDPTWGQLFVDATHIKLSEGSRDMAWANVAGDIKMKVLSYKKRK